MYYSPIKIAGIVAALLVCLILSLPNVLSSSQQDYLRQYGLKPMTLGLDLQGGLNLVLEVDRKSFETQLIDQAFSDVRSVLGDAKVSAPVRRKTPDGVSITIPRPEDAQKAKTALEGLRQPLGGGLFDGGTTQNLFDLIDEGNGRFQLKLSKPGLEAKIQLVMQQLLRIAAQRVNPDGTKEVVVQQQGLDRIAVQLPGEKDSFATKKLLEQTAKLSFQLLCDEQSTGPNSRPPQDCKELSVKVDPSDPNQPKVLWVQTSSRSTVDGADLVDAQPSIDQNNQPIVTFRFNQKGAVRFGKLTAENLKKPFAIILDDEIQSFPVIQSAILGGTGQISGNFTQEETANLSVVLRSGALPAKLTIVEERTVGPSLGSDSIKAGLVASLVGLAGVMAFMFLPYRFFGLIANFALLGNLLMLIAVMSFFGFTLTLPGIAGIVLTLGMAVDSNVLIYERIREEWRAGRTALNAIETGFKAALGTVLDANITTLIAAVVLFGIGSGPIRGFAVTLAVGIFTTMFTAFTLTRLLVSLWVRWKRPKEINL
jgi:protein-export membrane protein SecD